MSVVLDSSAILAFLQGEDGADVVEAHLHDDPRCGAANWSEVGQKVIAAGRDWELVRALLASYDVHVEPVSEADADWAARRWKAGEGLSLADRLCLGLANRLDVDVVTADLAWGSGDGVRQIR
ncbi:MAG: PIN domain-containing protein [Acidimicrobiia bacterium]|nr:PIN domain-containing protein [Acidimicrobiia bacterium]